jgi:hypothetical protein
MSYELTGNNEESFIKIQSTSQKHPMLMKITMMVVMGLKTCSVFSKATAGTHYSYLHVGPIYIPFSLELSLFYFFDLYDQECLLG